jgi:hypothetical protein
LKNAKDKDKKSMFGYIDRKNLQKLFTIIYPTSQKILIKDLKLIPPLQLYQIMDKRKIKKFYFVTDNIKRLTKQIQILKKTYLLSPNIVKKI